MLRVLKYILPIGAIVFSGIFLYRGTLNPCDRVIEYSIGQFDTQFGLSKENFQKYIEQSEVPWESEVGRQLFEYKEGARFEINLIYDERQVLTEQKRREEFGLTKYEDILREMDSKLSLLDAQYKRLSLSHEREVSSLELDQARYNKEIDSWNKKGGAPEPHFSRLEAERISLNSRVEALNTNAVTLNNMASELNQLIKSRNEAANNYNRVAKSYNEKYGHGLEFNQGEYSTDGQINIYQFDSPDSLRMVLAHELGHALGLDHVSGEYSIMNSVSSEVRTSLTLTAEDKAELVRMCKK